jgi:hypothetical protein
MKLIKVVFLKFSSIAKQVLKMKTHFIAVLLKSKCFPILSISDWLPVHSDVNVFVQNFIGLFRFSQRREYKMTSLP